MINNRLPLWFRQELPDAKSLEIVRFISKLNINTVCIEAKCPNLNSCFKNSYLTFMLLGRICTRNCRFCAVKKSDNKDLSLDLEEPMRIAKAVRKLNLNYVVLTSVTRDDLKDTGASIFVKTIEAIRNINKNIKIEVLIPDFKGDTLNLKCVLDTLPNVVGHNIETIKMLYTKLRPMADYEISLSVLANIKKIRPELTSKSGLILGLGETQKEVIKTLQDLRKSECDILSLGQYLAPSIEHYPVKEFITPEQFQKYKEIALDLGFKAVLSGPLVRSSYQAESIFKEFAYV